MVLAETSEKMRVVVIGAGPSGLATAVILARHGYQVEVYEKNLYPGGRCGRIVHDGFRFDTGATMMLMPGMYREVFGALGLDFDKDLPMVKMDRLYTVCFDDGSKLQFSTNPKEMDQQLEKFEPGSAARARDFANQGYAMYQLGFKRLLARNFTRWHQFINLSNVRMLFRLKVFIKQMTFTKRFFHDRRLQMAFTYQNIYVGQNPCTAPALFSMIPAAELKEGAWFPVGGMHALIRRLVAEAEKLGVTLHYGTGVRKILVHQRKANGVLLTDGSTVLADTLIATADLPYVYQNLLPPSLMRHRLSMMKYSCSAIVFHWGVHKRYSQLDHHTIFLSDTYREGMRDIFRLKRIGEDPCFYVHAPARSDPSAASEGCDALSVIVAVGHLHARNQGEWEAMSAMVRKAVLQKLKKAGLEDLEEQIRFERVFTPPQWESAVNVVNGSVFGSLAHSITQMGYFRPANRHRKYRNLWFAGGSTHPGNGVPMVLMSAKLVSERILSERNWVDGKQKTVNQKRP